MVWTPHTICGNDEGTAVFVLVHDGPLRLIVGLQRTVDAPDSLESRVVACFNDDNLVDDRYSFADRPAAREAIYKALNTTWEPTIANDIKNDSVFWITTAKDGRPVGTLYRETNKYNHYTSLLKPLSSLLPILGDASGVKKVVFGDITHLEPFLGRGTTTLAAIGGELVVYKGISFFEFLTFDTTAFQHQLAAFYHEIHILTTVIPPHPFIIPPPKTFVTPSSSTETDPSICGTIYPFFKNGTLDTAITLRTSISLLQKAKWSLQLVYAIYHAHTAHTFHMDIKPTNTLISDDLTLLVIDWEQCGANKFALAPEADGTFDVAISADGRLVYPMDRRNAILHEKPCKIYIPLL